jgi:hypothetical protein
MERKLNLKASASPSPLGLDVQSSDLSTTEEVSRADHGDPEYARDDKSNLRWRDAAETEKGEMKVSEKEPKPQPDGGGGCEGGGASENGRETSAIRDPLGDKGATSRDTKQGNRKKLQPKGSFRVIPKAMGPDAPRAYYAAAYMTIYVNTDHPQIAATGDQSGAEFKILLAECAASEFALALTAMRIENGDPDVDPGQWPTIITAIRREESETGVELAQAITDYRTGSS